jgi:hypothetical protein
MTWQGIPNARYHWKVEDKGRRGAILTSILKKWGVKLWTGFSCKFKM